MHGLLSDLAIPCVAQSSLRAIFDALWPYVLIFAGFSVVIFVHELGHFAAAKWSGVRVERFAIGFFTEIFGFTRGETRYSFNVLPLGGYVKMLGQEDFEDKAGELRFKEDPRSFVNKPVWRRMVIVSAGVVMNILFAAFLFLIVFMHGVEVVVPKVGYVEPESPAALAGLLPGDTIHRINGKEIKEFNEIQFAVKLADPHTPLDFEIDRDGRTLHVSVKPEPWALNNLQWVGIAAAETREVVLQLGPPDELAGVEQVQPGDVIVAVRGEELPKEALGPVRQQMRSADGAPVPVTVERPVPEGLEGETRRHDVVVYNEMVIHLRNPFNDRYTHDVLGLIPLARVNAMGDDKGRAALAGLKDGDIILKWGSQICPTRAQIVESIRKSAAKPNDVQPKSWRRKLYDWFTEDLETDIPVVVQRGKRQFAFEVTPKVADKGRPPSIGYQLNRVAGGLLRVAGVVEGDHDHPTPAAEAGIPKGAMILRVADVSVSTWPELVEQFRRRAGSTVNLAYRTIDGQENTCDFHVPHCLRTRLGLSTLSSIIAISDQRSVTIEDGHLRRSIAVSNSYGLAQILRKVWNESDQSPTTVTVRYTELPGGPELEREVVIDRQVLDPWLGRVKYGPALFMRQQTKFLRADGPIDAVSIGIQKTVYFVMQVYTMLERMIFSRSVGLKQVSGPVGIVKVGGDFARMGFIQLLFFLAIISANLAVINFLPLPIVDGGLMVFLIIEKIKGTPVSIKVQVVTQMLGIVLLLSLFLYVTFQDVLRWAQ